MTAAPQVQALLDAFEDLAGGDLPWVASHSGGVHDVSIAIGCLVHGDEVGPLAAVLEVLRALRVGALPFGGQVNLFVGNPEAARRGVRFIDQDLNRIFVDPPPDGIEGRRAAALRPLLDRCDVFLDLHQTGRPSAHPFFTLPWRPMEAAWVQAIGVGEAWVTRAPGAAFAPGTCCADEYVRARGAAGVTLELGQRGLSEGATAGARTAITRALRVADALATDPQAVSRAAASMPTIPAFVYTHAEPFGTRARGLREGLVNFQRVQAGEVLSPPDRPPVVAPMSGTLLFPTYPARDQDGLVTGPLPSAMFRIIQPLTADPAALWGRALHP